MGIASAHGCGTIVPLVASVTADNGCFLRALGLTIPSANCSPAARGEAGPTAYATRSDAGNPACTDSDGFADNGESVSFEVTAGQTIYVRVTAISSDAQIEYKLVTALIPN